MEVEQATTPAARLELTRSGSGTTCIYLTAEKLSLDRELIAEVPDDFAVGLQGTLREDLFRFKRAAQAWEKSDLQDPDEVLETLHEIGLEIIYDVLGPVPARSFMALME